MTRGRRGWLWVVAFATALSVSPAHAYRPFDGTDAGVADPGEFELEFGPIQHSREGSTRSWIAPAAVANWGVAHDREIVLDAPVARVSGKDVPMPYAANLEKLALPSVAEVVEAAKAVSYR